MKFFKIIFLALATVCFILAKKTLKNIAQKHSPHESVEQRSETEYKLKKTKKRIKRDEDEQNNRVRHIQNPRPIPRGAGSQIYKRADLFEVRRKRID